MLERFRLLAELADVHVRLDEAAAAGNFARSRQAA